MHEIAGEIDQYWRNGQLDRARSLIGELLVQRDVVLGALSRLEIEVAQSA